MKKVVLVLGVTGYCAIASAQSSVTLYGIIDAGVSYVSHAATSTASDHLVKYGEGVASGNRWGLRGTEDLGGGLLAVFVLENGFNTGDGTIGQGGAIFGRQAFVGLTRTGFGTLSIGRQYSFSTEYLGANYTTGSQTALGNYAYHINDVDQLTSSRINNAVKFSSTSFNGLTFGAMYGFSNQAGSFAGSPTTTAANTTTQGASSAYSFGLNYAGGNFGIGAAYTNIRFPNGATPAFSVSLANVNTLGLRDLETYGVGARWAFGSALVWGNWTHTRFEPVSGSASTLNVFEGGGRYMFRPTLSAGLGYTYYNLKGGTQGRWNEVGGAVDYALSKRTDIYALTAYQKASGSNFVGGQVVPVQAEIGSSTSFFGSSGRGANSQLAARIGLRTRF
jgi:predicted porin